MNERTFCSNFSIQAESLLIYECTVNMTQLTESEKPLDLKFDKIEQVLKNVDMKKYLPKFKEEKFCDKKLQNEGQIRLNGRILIDQ